MSQDNIGRGGGLPSLAGFVNIIIFLWVLVADLLIGSSVLDVLKNKI